MCGTHEHVSNSTVVLCMAGSPTKVAAIAAGWDETSHSNMNTTDMITLYLRVPPSQETLFLRRRIWTALEPQTIRHAKKTTVLCFNRQMPAIFLYFVYSAKFVSLLSTINTNKMACY